MPAIETDCREQFAVLVAATGVDGYGDNTGAVAIEIKVRWELGKTEAVDSLGNTIGIDVVAVVDRVIKVGSTLWQGRLADYPASPANLKQVVDYKETPDIKGREFRRVVLLRKMSDEVLATT